MRRDISIVTERKHCRATPEFEFTLWSFKLAATELRRAAERAERRKHAEEKRTAPIKRIDHMRFSEPHWGLEWDDPKYGRTGTFNCFATRADALKQLRRCYNSPDPMYREARNIPFEIVFFPGSPQDR
ncbi:hypothetical protein CPT_Maja_092 [Burkholderia phage Maja]|uniref:Uncharacterized protein n=1 Tax=Burkholderia phage Maja TaxID=2767571 RepID=A0A7S6U0B0_9CAUD|nr:hypothetical protein CPT_Maja_092 [Burkholderia phage Maja]